MLGSDFLLLAETIDHRNCMMKITFYEECGILVFWLWLRSPDCLRFFCSILPLPPLSSLYGVVDKLTGLPNGPEKFADCYYYYYHSYHNNYSDVSFICIYFYFINRGKRWSQPESPIYTYISVLNHSRYYLPYNILVRILVWSLFLI